MREVQQVMLFQLSEEEEVVFAVVAAGSLRTQQADHREVFVEASGG